MTKQNSLKKLTIPLFLVTLLLSVAFTIQKFAEDSHDFIWGGSVSLTDEVKAVLSTNTMQRLRDIDQSGPARYFGPMIPKFSRYDHSVAVWALIKGKGGGLKEQIAALLHDSSHTVFSHVGDHIFAKNTNQYSENSYQDSIHMPFLKKQNLTQIVKQIGLNIDDLDPDNKDYRILEQPLPDLCADRIQYNLHTAVLLGLMSKKEARDVYDDLSFEDGKWLFHKQHMAKRFAEVSIYFTQNFWGARWNTSLNMHLANALKRALNLKIISEQDLFSTDSVIMNKLTKNQDHIIQVNLQQCKKPLEKIPGQKYKTVKYIPKFRGTDPLVKHEGAIVRLTDIDPIFHNYYQEVKSWCRAGFELDVLDME